MKKKEKMKANKEINSSIKLRIYPTKEQKEVYKQWMGTSRFLYNKALNYLNSPENKDIKKNISTLRSFFINSDSQFHKDHIFLNDIPYDIKDEALRTLLKNYKSNFAKKKVFNLKYKSKKYSTESFNVLAKHYSHKTRYYGGMFNLRSEKPLPKVLEHTAVIIMTKSKEFFICIPRTLKIKESPEYKDSKKEVSIDPGVRTFLTCYDPDGLIMKFGKHDGEFLSKLLSKKRKLISLREKSKGRLKYKLNIALKRMLETIKNLIDDCHKKIANFLCSNYNIIIIPKLNFHTFKKMSSKNRSKMSIWSHCSFVDRLITKSKMYSNCVVKVVTEEYTSMTCSCCGFIKTDLGSSEEYNCNKCKNVLCRDINGSKNIFMKIK